MAFQVSRAHICTCSTMQQAFRIVPGSEEIKTKTVKHVVGIWTLLQGLGSALKLRWPLGDRDQKVCKYLPSSLTPAQGALEDSEP